ncbi:MAG TPA: carbon-nitrogen hydrolase family protein [Mycobacteriales bacterium]|nr:carbon-nitrogen hydrolase family protein [Mycobacteriales bacterium]
MIPVVVGQIPICWSVQRNVEVVTEAVRRTDPGSLLVLPEAALSGYDDELSGLAGLDPERIGWACEQVAAAATAADVIVVCGTLLPEDGHWWNAGICFRPGRPPWIYRKVNLAMHERGRLNAGSALPTVPLQLPAGEVIVGIQLCREIRFPEQWHHLARQGAQLLIYLTYAANPAEPPGVWRAHLISRAAETQRFLVAANVAHPDQHCPSLIVSPRGEVLGEAAPGQAARLECSLDLTAVRDHYLDQQRGDVVRITGPRERAE